MRLEESELRRAVLANLAEEKGCDDATGNNREHAELWLDFAEGMGASRTQRGHKPVAEMNNLMAFFHEIASEGTPEEALAAFYTYESQVPRVAAEKARGLRETYGADERTCGYFDLHRTADVYHSQIWRQQLARCLELNPQAAEPALAAAENAAKALWNALDGIEARRVAKPKAA
jgi:pyrroloquinoline-quinone synthase